MVEFGFDSRTGLALLYVFRKFSMGTKQLTSPLVVAHSEKNLKSITFGGYRYTDVALAGFVCFNSLMKE